jgi:LPPG:FO 2-phospho-L-lactate transferase
VKVTALAGGIGGAKLLVGLQRALPDARKLSAIVNTGDDASIYGVHVSPDVDIVTYWLAGVADIERGWGLRGDTFELIDALASLGGSAWFRLGDRDFGTCLYRTQRLDQGVTLSAVADEIGRAFGVAPRIIPMSDDPIRTRIVTGDGRTLEFQEYFVREGCGPEVAAISFEGVDHARPAPGVIEALTAADIVVLCPSNPFVSIGPILALPGVRDALRERTGVTAVSPIVGGAALKGPAAKMLASLGHDVNAAGVAALYSDIVDTFVVDQIDETDIASIESSGLRAVALDTIMSDHDAAERLAMALLAA